MVWNYAALADVVDEPFRAENLVTRSTSHLSKCGTLATRGVPRAKHEQTCFDTPPEA